MIDEIDRIILDGLARDGRRQFTALATDAGVSEATIRSRVTRLQESGVLRIVALCNPLTMGHQSIRILLSVRDHTPRSVGQALVGISMVNQVALVTGAHDVYVEATCRDLDQLVELLDLIRRIPGVATMRPLILTQLFKDYSWDGLDGGLGQGTGGEETPKRRPQ